ncbi:MAG: PD40 domain-containing protein, partial [Candidatus Eisenbacteria bacterium]|nr:PD40 domain-containing protein [Candidatus Eisenbacteria bacterium]
MKTAKRKITAEDLLRFQFLSSPQISPDGGRIVFVKKRAHGVGKYKTDLWLVDVDSEGSEAPLTNVESDSMPRWSPGGTRIGFVRAGKDKDPQIHLIDPDGGEARQLTRFPEGAIRDFAWAPDGRTLAVVYRETIPQLTREARKAREKDGASTPPLIVETPFYREDGDGYFGEARFALYLVDTTTGEHRRIFQAPLGIDGFSWSPDAKELAVVANLDRRAALHPWKSSIYRVDVRNGRTVEVKGLPEGPKANVDWSPDGKLLAYAGRLGQDEMYSPDNAHLWVVDPRGGRPRNLTRNTDHCLMATCISDAGDPAFGA